jgi:uncharacterized phage protein gp47/JayE
MPRDDDRTTRYTGRISRRSRELLDTAIAGSGALPLNTRAVLDLLVAGCTDVELKEAMAAGQALEERSELHCRMGQETRKRLATAAVASGAQVDSAVDRLLVWLGTPRIWEKLGKAARSAVDGIGAES